MSADSVLSGPANYRESLRLLALAADLTEEAMGLNPGGERELGVHLAGIYVGAATAHAALAQAAAAALHHVGEHILEVEKDAREWAVAIGSVRDAPLAWSLTVDQSARLDRQMDIEDDDRHDRAEEASWT